MRICKNCGLFDPKSNTCGVTVIQGGEYYEITTKPDDPCVWEEIGVEVNQIRIWSDGKNGYVEQAEK